MSTSAEDNLVQLLGTDDPAARSLINQDELNQPVEEAGELTDFYEKELYATTPSLPESPLVKPVLSMANLPDFKKSTAQEPSTIESSDSLAVAKVVPSSNESTVLLPIATAGPQMPSSDSSALAVRPGQDTQHQQLSAQYSAANPHGASGVLTKG